MTDLGTGINILLGGEPLSMKEDLVDLVKWMGNNEIPYCLITNSVEMGQWRQKLVDVGLSNWSPSIDTLGASNLDHSIKLKSRKTIEHLEFFKRAGVEDLVTQITATNQNLEEIPSIIKYFSDQEIWSEVMALNHSKSKYYDYCSKKEEMPDLIFHKKDLPRLIKVANELKIMAEEGYMIHNHTDFFSTWPEFQIECDWICKAPSVLTIDSDGSMRSCVYFKGDIVNSVSVFDLENEEGQTEFLAKWRVDWSEKCEGCLWDCMQMANKYQEQAATKKGKDWFAHDLKASDREFQR
jgi:MoaA/NifB/PqqE/SkfB family radical SAM enzyme